MIDHCRLGRMTSLPASTHRGGIICQVVIYRGRLPFLVTHAGVLVDTTIGSPGCVKVGRRCSPPQALKGLEYDVGDLFADLR